MVKKAITKSKAGWSDGLIKILNNSTVKLIIGAMLTTGGISGYVSIKNSVSDNAVKVDSTQLKVARFDSLRKANSAYVIKSINAHTDSLFKARFGKR